jgi:hypothetical protein
MTYYLNRSEWMNHAHNPEGMNIGMVNDDNRIRLLTVELQKEAKDKIVIDLGAGTGLLGMYALDFGAKFVYFVEADPQMYHILVNVLPKKLNDGSYKIIHKDIETLTIDDFECGIPEIAVSEFYGPRLFDEGYVNYSKHVRTLFSDIRFIPETFKVDFYLTDVDLRDYIWPRNKRLLDHYMFMYREKGFTSRNKFRYFDEDLVGTILFNANTQAFSNEVTVSHSVDKVQVLLSKATVEHGESSFVFTNFGWVFSREDIGKTFKIYFDEDNYFNPKKIDITDAE